MRNHFPKGVGDLLVGLFLLMFLAAVGVSAVHGSRDAANRARYASNLHQIGLGILLYQGDNKRSYPRGDMDETGDPKPVWGTPYEANKNLGPISGADPQIPGKTIPEKNDVTAALFLLLRNEQLTASVFICPSSKLKPWDFGGGDNTAQDWSNWQGNQGLATHLSYSYQNPYASKAAVADGLHLDQLDANFAVAGDMNPGGDAELKVTVKSGIQEMKSANSLNHGGEGQNVLYGDGHAEWQPTPFCGPLHDNIFTACGPEIFGHGRGNAVFAASSSGRGDCILLPTAADIGFKGPPEAKPLTAEQLDKVKKDVQGVYEASYPYGRRTYHAVLKVDDNKLISVIGAATVSYTYRVTGGDDDGLQLDLIGPGETDPAVLSLNGDKLFIDSTLPLGLNLFWQRKGTKN